MAWVVRLLLGGFYVGMLGFRAIGKKPGQDPKVDAWHSRYGGMMKVCGLGLVLFGVYLMMPAIHPIVSESFWVVEESPYFPAAVGTAWTYKAGDSRLHVSIKSHERMAGKMCALLETSVDGKASGTEHIRPEADGVYTYASNGARHDPPMCVFKWPPISGQQWSYRSNDGSIQADFTMEEVTGLVVPSGEYSDCFRVVTNITGEGKHHRYSSWFVRGIGIAKQVRGEDESLPVELETFTALHE